MRHALFLSLLIALLAPAAPAAAAAPVKEPVHEVIDRENPCTGEPTRVHLDGWLRLEPRETPAGNFHLLVQVHVDWWSTDGFSGTARQTTTLTARGDDQVFHETVHFVGRDGSGRVVRHRTQLNRRTVGDRSVVDILHEESTCSGRTQSTRGA